MVGSNGFICDTKYQGEEYENPVSHQIPRHQDFSLCVDPAAFLE